MLLDPGSPLLSHATEKNVLQHWSNPSLRFTLHITCVISVIVYVCMHVPVNPMAVVFPHNLRFVGHCFCVHACGSQSIHVLSPFLIHWHFCCGHVVCIWDRFRRLASFFRAVTDRRLRQMHVALSQVARTVSCRFSLLHHDASKDKHRKLVVTGWMFHWCRRTGLGIVIGPNTCQYVRHSLLGPFQSLSLA